MKAPIGCGYRSERIGAEVYVAHEEASIPLIKAMVRALKPTVIVELGTYGGGLTLALHDAVPETELHSFDLHVTSVGETVSTIIGAARRDWFGRKVHFYPADLLHGPHPLVVSLVSRPRVFLYCDNGNKPHEVRTYAPLLRPGSVVGTHDWDTEICWGHVAEDLREFVPYRQAEFVAAGVSSRFWIRRPSL